jgi:hypothetical protein
VPRSGGSTDDRGAAEAGDDREGVGVQPAVLASRGTRQIDRSERITAPTSFMKGAVAPVARKSWDSQQHPRPTCDMNARSRTTRSKEADLERHSSCSE